MVREVPLHPRYEVLRTHCTYRTPSRGGALLSLLSSPLSPFYLKWGDVCIASYVLLRTSYPVVVFGRIQVQAGYEYAHYICKVRTAPGL